MSEAFDSWAVVELMGHVRMAGRVTEEERFGCKMGRCDVPGEDDSFTSVYFTGSSVYRMTPCSEEAARAVARRAQPEPVHQWELPKPVDAAKPSQPYSDSFTAQFDDDDQDDSRDMDF